MTEAKHRGAEDERSSAEWVDFRAVQQHRPGTGAPSPLAGYDAYAVSFLRIGRSVRMGLRGAPLHSPIEQLGELLVTLGANEGQS